LIISLRVSNVQDPSTAALDASVNNGNIRSASVNGGSSDGLRGFGVEGASTTVHKTVHDDSPCDRTSTCNNTE
jgi:hypothetical protein